MNPKNSVQNASTSKADMCATALVAINSEEMQKLEFLNNFDSESLADFFFHF